VTVFIEHVQNDTIIEMMNTLLVAGLKKGVE
jgi:hypothetical protein